VKQEHEPEPDLITLDEGKGRGRTPFFYDQATPSATEELPEASGASSKALGSSAQVHGELYVHADDDSFPTRAKSSFWTPSAPSIFSLGNLGFEAAPTEVPHLSGPVLQPTMLVQQPEGLTLSVYGPEVKAQPQRTALQVRMFAPGMPHDIMFNILIAERSGLKGILLETVQHFPVAYADTSHAYPSSGGQERHVKIYDHVPEPDTEQPTYVHVKETIRGQFDIAPVTDGEVGELWYQARQTAGSFTIVDAVGRLQASVSTRFKDGQSNVDLVIALSQHVDAALILTSIVAMTKLSTLV
jgi:hypothetical protein